MTDRGTPVAAPQHTSATHRGHRVVTRREIAIRTDPRSLGCATTVARKRGSREELDDRRAVFPIGSPPPRAIRSPRMPGRATPALEDRAVACSASPALRADRLPHRVRTGKGDASSILDEPARAPREPAEPPEPPAATWFSI
jgi:hypothetical protein